MTQQTALPPAAAAPQPPRRLRSVLSVDHFFGSLFLLTVYPALGLLLAARKPGTATSAGVVGASLFCYSASAGFPRIPAVLQLVLVGTLGTFVYAQFHSAFALQVGRDFSSGAMRFVLVTMPAMAIMVTCARCAGPPERSWARWRTGLFLVLHDARRAWLYSGTLGIVTLDCTLLLAFRGRRPARPGSATGADR